MDNVRGSAEVPEDQIEIADQRMCRTRLPPVVQADQTRRTELAGIELLPEQLSRRMIAFPVGERELHSRLPGKIGQGLEARQGRTQFRGQQEMLAGLEGLIHGGIVNVRVREETDRVAS